MQSAYSYAKEREREFTVEILEDEQSNAMLFEETLRTAKNERFVAFGVNLQHVDRR